MVEIYNNIRLLYRFLKPVPQLAHLIDFFSETATESVNEYVDGKDFTIKLFPSYTPTIWINLGSPYYLKSNSYCRQIEKDSDILLLRDTTVEKINLVTDKTFTIKFNPGGIETIFGISQQEIADQIIPANAIIPESLIKKLKTLDILEEKVQLLERLFLEKLEQRAQSKSYHLQYVNRAISLFEESHMAMTNEALAQQLCITEKSLYRYFNHVVGTSPKSYFAIKRAREALTSFAADPKNFSYMDFGYYDRSHFYKSVSIFTGTHIQKYSKLILEK